MKVVFFVFCTANYFFILETSRRIFRMHNIIDLTMEHIKEKLVGEKSLFSIVAYIHSNLFTGPLHKLLLEHKIEHADAIVQSFSKHFNPKVQASEVCEDSKVCFFIICFGQTIYFCGYLNRSHRCPHEQVKVTGVQLAFLAQIWLHIN